MLQVAVIGYGRAGEAHAHCYQQFPGVQIAAILDVAPARRRRGREHFPDAAIVTEIDRLPPSINLALVCTPPSSHEHYTEVALLRGMHVFCEKPAFLRPDTGQRLVELARRRRLVIYPGHNYVFSPQLQALREHSGVENIGHLRRMTIDVERTGPAQGHPDWQPGWRTDSAFSHGGIIVDHGPHCIYLTEWLSGRPIHRVGYRLGLSAARIDDVAEITLDLGDTVSSRITLSWTANARRTRYKLIGERGWVLADESGVTLHRPTGKHTVHAAATDDSHTHQQWLPALARDVLRCLSGAGEPAVLIQQALTVARVLAAANHADGHSSAAVVPLQRLQP